MRRERLIYLGVYIALSAAFCWPLLAQPLAEGTGDWDQHLFYYASVLHNGAYGQLPFWNPWYCGGNVLWQNPQVSLISPVYLLSVVMPLAFAMKLNIVGHYIVGFLGMHLVLRRVVGLQSPIAVVYLGSLFVFSGAMALHFEVGHSDFLSMFWLPALVYCFARAAAEHIRSLIAGAAIVAVTILNGGPHAVPVAAVLLGCLGLGALVFGRTVKPLAIAVVIVILGCIYATPRLVPSWLWLQSAEFHDTRPIKHPDRMSVEMLRVALWDSSQGTPTRLNRTEQLYGWQEYGGYMGWLGAGLAMLSAAWILVFRRARDLWLASAAALGLIIVLLLALGEFAPLAPASLMHKLPFFSSFRIPSRHILLVPIVGALCIAYAMRAIEGAGRSGLRRAVELVFVVSLCQLALVNRSHFREVFILPAGGPASQLFEQQTPTIGARDVPRVGAPTGVLNTNMLGSMLSGVSPLDCWEPLQVRKVAVPGPTALVADDAAASASITDQRFSPNRIAATVIVGATPARIVLNQNFAEGWSANAGTVERDPGSGRPSVVLPAGFSGTVAFNYFPAGLWLGVIISTIAIALSLVVWRRERRGVRPGSDPM